MCKPCTHIIIVQIKTHNDELHSIIIYKHEMDLKLYALTFKVGKCITKSFLIFLKIEIQFDYKYMAQVIYNKSFLPLKQKVITKIMNHNNQILSFKTLCLYKLMFSFVFVEMICLNHNFFIPPCLLEIYHIMIFNVTHEMKSITYI